MSLADSLKIAAAALLLVIVTGCGFQLRSTDVSSLGVINIAGTDARSDVGRALAEERRMLRARTRPRVVQDLLMFIL